MTTKSDRTRLPQPPHRPSSQAQQMAGISRDTGPANNERKRMPVRSTAGAPEDRGRRRATGPGVEAARQRSNDRPRKEPPPNRR